MAKKSKFNVLLIASHHGFFLTLQSILRFKKNIDKLVVVIPEEKIEKYSGMDGHEFQNYQSLVTTQTKAFDKSAKIYTAKFDMFHRVSQTAEFLREINANGVWFEICAGSVLNNVPNVSEIQDNFLCMSSQRCYEGNKKLDMYMMLGQPNVSVFEKQNTDTFIINADHIPATILPDFYLIKEAMQKGMFKSLNPHCISNEEELVDLAFGGKQLIDHAAKAADCLVADYWSVVMQPNQAIDKLYGYPLELYLPFVERCKGLIPEITLQRIKDNATESKTYSLAFRDALS